MFRCDAEPPAQKSGPKGLRRPVWGNAPGIDAPNLRGALTGRDTRLSHAGSVVSPLQGLVLVSFINLGRCPRLVCGWPFGRLDHSHTYRSSNSMRCRLNKARKLVLE